MRTFTKEYQIWSHLADMYESRTLGGQGICLAIGALWAGSRISILVHDACIARLKKRFEPRWWEFLRKRYLPYFWKQGETKPRAAACDELFYESFDEEKARERRMFTGVDF